eukprot:gene18799-biopygen5652
MSSCHQEGVRERNIPRGSALRENGRGVLGDSSFDSSSIP